jgi:CRISPR-associated protein Csm1
MSEELFVVGDLSGIQDYVLSVSAQGGGQARRLRARSFFVQVAQEVAARAILESLGATWDDAVVFHGGGQFLLRLPAPAQAEEKLLQLRAELESELRRETRAGLALTIGWGRSIDDALRRKEREKRSPWASTVIGSRGWEVSALSLEPFTSKPCDVCGQHAGVRTRNDGEEEVWLCTRCDDDTEIGKRLPVSPREELVSAGDFHILGRGIRLMPAGAAQGASALHTSNLHVPPNKTFRDIADQAQGDNLLAVLKADVDNAGAKLADRRGALDSIKEFSRALDDFFSHQVQQKLEHKPWSWMYTIYSGGDDLLMVGPWNVVLDFAGEVHREFSQGPGGRYGVTISAGIALTDYHTPVRESVARADELLELAKGRRQVGSDGAAGRRSATPAGNPTESEKNSCAALGWVWKWERHAALLSEGKKLKVWIDQNVCPRSMAHRLLSLAERTDPLRTAHWAYEVGRNFPKSNDTSPEARGFRAWGERALAEILEDPGAAGELAVELRYALRATRPRREKI